MKSLTLRLYPDPLLRKKAREVPLQDVATLQPMFEQMIETMHVENGIGLAAPQVGVSKRIIVVDHKDGPLVLINPILSKLSFKKEHAEEGCLSIPGVSGMVKRHARLHFEATDPKGRQVTGDAEGLFARVLQHEIDHINGVLFIDRVSRITHGKIQKI